MIDVAIAKGPLTIPDWLAQKSETIAKLNQEGLYPIYVAAREGREEVIQWLAQRGCSVSTPGKRGWRTMHYAAAGGKVSTHKIRLKLGASANANTDDSTISLNMAKNRKQRGCGFLSRKIQRVRGLWHKLGGIRPRKTCLFSHRPPEISERELWSMVTAATTLAEHVGLDSTLDINRMI